jgi:hypothetical protein
MDAQKPIMGSAHPTPDCPPCDVCRNRSAATSFIELLKILTERLLPPRWVCLSLMFLTVIYFAPSVIDNWINRVARLTEGHKRRQQRYDPARNGEDHKRQ